MGGPQAADVLTTVKQDQRTREGKTPMEGSELENSENRFSKSMKLRLSVLFNRKIVG